MIRDVMDDLEAYGQLRDRPLPVEPGTARGRGRAIPGDARPETGAEGRPAAPPIAKPKSAHWVRNTVLLIAAYFVLAVGTTVQPVPVPFTSVKVAVPFPGGAPLLFGLPRIQRSAPVWRSNFTMQSWVRNDTRMESSRAS